MPSVRDIRLACGYSQRAFAMLLGVPLETYRPIDSGRRATPRNLHEHATRMLTEHERSTDLFTLDVLAREFHIHPRTLRAAARDERLQVQLSTRSVFGRPVRLATRVAMDEFVRVHYRQRYSRYAPPVTAPPVLIVPANFATQLIALRVRFRLTQAALAQRIGAASKAVIYQWESERRTPSPVLWQRVEQLARSASAPSNERHTTLR